MKLQQLQIFQNLTEEELEKSLVCSQAVVKKYPKDTYIFRQGDVPLKLYFILEGMVELGSINLNGKITRSSYVYITVRLSSICFSFLRKKQRNVTVR